MKGFTILITGGTGSFGKAMVKRLLQFDISPKIIVFSRDEYKQSEMMKEFGEFPKGKLRFFVGDVRNKQRLIQAMRDVDLVIHAAALKNVPLCEYNPYEAVMTNIFGSYNVILAALYNKVKKVIALSSDKACNPINLYGATKLVMERLFVEANILGKKETIFSLVRYGNVLASRGSVVELFKKQIADKGRLSITDEAMTRFWWPLEQAVQFVIDSIEDMNGGEIYIPKLKSANILKLAYAMISNFKYDIIGIRSGEKLHELLISPDEINRAYEKHFCYYIAPSFEYFKFDKVNNGTLVKNDFVYSSNSNPNGYFTTDELREMING